MSLPKSRLVISSEEKQNGFPDSLIKRLEQLDVSIPWEEEVYAKIQNEASSIKELATLSEAAVYSCFEGDVPLDALSSKECDETLKLEVAVIRGSPIAHYSWAPEYLVWPTGRKTRLSFKVSFQTEGTSGSECNLEKSESVRFSWNEPPALFRNRRFKTASEFTKELGAEQVDRNSHVQTNGACNEVEEREEINSPERGEIESNFEDCSFNITPIQKQDKALGQDLGQGCVPRAEREVDNSYLKIWLLILPLLVLFLIGISNLLSGSCLLRFLGNLLPSYQPLAVLRESLLS
ncbi:hypothetical protein R1flu_006198 [Riccia fluitans]|uniref:Uncharacterized protein n=1 Tax=Riccia fluitans TaxID=41844 RepID=A0ABD1YY49_9MARC